MISDLIIYLVIVVGISALGIFLSGLPGIFLLWLAQPYISCLFDVNPLKKIDTEVGFALILFIGLRQNWLRYCAQSACRIVLLPRSRPIWSGQGFGAIFGLST